MGEKLIYLGTISFWIGGIIAFVLTLKYSDHGRLPIYKITKNHFLEVFVIPLIFCFGGMLLFLIGMHILGKI